MSTRAVRWSHSPRRQRTPVAWNGLASASTTPSALIRSTRPSICREDRSASRASSAAEERAIVSPNDAANAWAVTFAWPSSSERARSRG